MNTYDKSSLILIPSGIKDGKVYSQRPENGDGDFTFSRGSNLAATRVDVNGLIEKGRENLLLQSNQFDTTWVLNGGATLGSRVADPNGGNNAWELNFSTTGGSRIEQQITTSSGKLYVFSFYARVATGTLNILVGAVGTLKTRTLTTEWQRFEVYGTAAATSFPQIRDTSSDANTIQIFNAQFELGLVATDYIETTTTTAQAGILEDMPRLDYSGSCPALLLEPQRSNLITHSELLTDSSWINQLDSTIDVAQASSISGYNDAWKLNKASGTFKSLRLQKTLASDNYSLTWFLKAGTISIAEFRFDGGLGAQFIDFDLSNGTHGTNANLSNIEMTAFNNGWYRCSASINTSLTNVHLYIDDASVSSGAGYIYAQYPQLEAGSYATSYIPTYGTSVTRSEENCENTDIDLLSQDAATYFLESTPISITSNNILEVRGNGSTNDRLLMQTNSSGALRILVINSGSTILDSNISSAVSAGTKIKVALKYTSTNISVFVDGIKKIDSDLSVDFGSPLDWINLEGTATANNDALEHHQFLFFPEALSDADCITLTTL